ncbi:MAG TPA: carboxypeptidase-like regulatory domain-containing protein [Terracidiphilus sp.]|nr:carboxypeptidase-like regulatory domain-containing protein [Terracidiphilus sp.]
MLKPVKFAIAMALPLVFSCGILAQNQTVVYAKVFSVQSLSGIVQDEAGKPIRGAKVEELTDGWKATLSVVLTDEKGFFLIQTHQRHTLHYLRFTMPNFNPVLIKVRASRWARKKSLSISLPVAN